MKNNVIKISILLVSVFIFSCKKKDKAKPESFMEEKVLDVSSITKRTYSDMLDNIFNELQEEYPQFDKIEKEIDLLKKMRNDSNAYFLKYNGHNETYYNVANLHIEQITDSVLKSRMHLLIDSSKRSYYESIQSYRFYNSQLDTAIAELNDWFEVLKITTTLNKIHEYQQVNQFDTSSLIKLKEKVNIAAGSLDSLIKILD